MLVMEKKIDRSVKGRVCECLYCGNAIFSVEDNDVDLKENPIFLSPKQVINVCGVEDSKFPSDRIELFCCRCGVSLGYMLLDRSGVVGDSTFIRANMLEVSSNLQGAA
jgi:peptide methionine sulfoxide reductase MsrB